LAQAQFPANGREVGFWKVAGVANKAAVILR
jgi:hypothetical protein